MKKAFEQINLGGIELKNRFVRSAAGSGIASEEGQVTADVLNRYKEETLGGPGLLITEMMTVWDDGNFPTGYLRIDKDHFIDGLKDLTSLVHKEGGKIMAQLGNYGSLLHHEPVNKPWGPSSVEHRISGIIPKEMDHRDIRFIINHFAEARYNQKLWIA